MRRWWHPPDFRRGGTAAGGQSAGPAQPEPLSRPYAGSCTCPAGQVTHAMVSAGKRTDAAGRDRLQAFLDGAVCRACPLRSQCIAAKGRQGRKTPAAGGTSVAANTGIERTGGSGAQIGPAGAGHPPVPLLRACQDKYLSQPPWAKRAVPVAAQQATASSAMMSSLLSPMLRQFQRC